MFKKKFIGRFNALPEQEPLSPVKTGSGIFILNVNHAVNGVAKRSQSPAGRGSSLEFNSLLREYACIERMFDLAHFGHEIGGVDHLFQYVIDVTAGQY